MSKKKQTKKHKFKYAGPADGSAVAPSSEAAAAIPARGAAPARAVTSGRDFSYVGRDLRRIAVLAAGLVVLELALWYLFAHTGVGPAVYTFVKV